MSIDIGEAISRGFDDLTSERGVAVFAIYLVFGFASTAAFMSLFQRLFEAYVDFAVESTDLTRDELLEQAGGMPAFPLALDVSLPVAAALTAVVMLLSLLVAIVAIRIFASESAEPIPVGEVTRNLGRTLVFYVVAMILVGVIVSVGLVFLVFPGVVLGFLLIFTQYAVAVDDAGPVEALKKSYGLVTDDPIEVLVLFFALVALAVVVSLPFALLPIPEPINTVVSNVITLAVSVFAIAAFTDAYLQATGQREYGPEADL